MTTFLRKPASLFALLSFASLAGLTHLRAETAVSTVTLSQCVAWAQEESETLALQQAEIDLQAARYREALGAFFPSLHFQFTDTFQDVSGVNNSNNNSGSGNTSTRRERPEAKLHLRQPLFSGFREFNAMRGYEAGGRQQRLLHRRVANQLYLDVAQVFYTVVLLEQDLADVRALSGLMDERLRELRGRIRLGKSRDSELLTVESQSAVIKAELEEIAGNILVARQALSFLTGRDMALSPLADGLEPGDPGPVENYTVRAASRTDVLAEREALEVQRHTLNFARGAYWPTADVAGNYYLKRVGNQEPIDWDVIFSLDVPIFQGGAARAQVRAAKLLLRQAELRLRRAARNAESEIRTAHLTLKRTMTRTQNLREASEKARRSYTLQTREYRLGLVNNLDVLSALDALTTTERAYDRARFQAKIDWLQLKLAAEDLP